MAETLEKLKVIIEASNAPFKKVFEETKQFVHQTTDAINNETQSVKAPFEDGKKVGTARTAIRALIEDLKVARGTHVYTEDFLLLRADIENADAKAKELANEMRLLELLGEAEGNEHYQELADELDNVRAHAESAREALANVMNSGQATKSVGLVANLKRIAAGFTTAKKAAAQFISGGIKKAGGAFASLIHKMSDGIGKLKSFGSGLRSAGQRAGGLVSSIFKAGLGLQSLGAIMNWVKGAIKEGFQNMVQADTSGQLNQSLSMLMSSFTQLKNAVAAAAAPIVSAIAPALNTLIQLATAAATAVGQLIATLTGQSTFLAAKKVNQDYASSLNNNAKSASGAAKANEQLKRTLLGFDEINKLDDNSSSSGGGGGGGGISAADMFEEVPIDSQISGFAEKIKEAWRNSDFTMIGFTLGEKIRDGLDNIDWEKIQEKVNGVAKSIATFLNGIFETEGLFGTVGDTAGEALNTALGGLNTYAKEFHWSSLGVSISESINGFFRRTDFKLAADTVSNWGKGILRSIRVGIENTDWYLIGKDVATFIKNIDWSGLSSELFRGIGAAVGGLAAFIWGLVEGAWNTVVSWWREVAYEDGQFTIQGLLLGIWDAVKNIGTWIYNNIFKPFKEGFERAFRIGSPSKVFEDEGGFIMDGLLNGLKNNINKVVDWFKNLPQTIISKIGEITMDVKAEATEFKDKIKSSKFVSGVKAWFTGTEDKLSGEQKKIRGVTAEVDDYKDTISPQKQRILDGYMADLIGSTDHINDKTVTGFTSEFKTRTFGSQYPWTITGMTSRFDGRSFGSSFSYTVGGMKARYDSALDNIPSSQKVIGVTAKITGGIQGLGSYILKKAETGGVFSGGRWNPIERYDSGGWPSSAQIFMARENGLPEMVGTIGGHTAVANNGQIVASVAAGVRDAVTDVFAAMIAFMDKPSDDSGDIVLYLGDEEVARAARRGEKKLNRQYKIVTEVS